MSPCHVIHTYILSLGRYDQEIMEVVAKLEGDQEQAQNDHFIV